MVIWNTKSCTDPNHTIIIRIRISLRIRISRHNSSVAAFKDVMKLWELAICRIGKASSRLMWLFLAVDESLKAT